eukprot:scaffold45108_cov20-Tisochrysis_lutea.AAC.2
MPTCVTAVRIQWRYLAFELASGPGAGPLCMGPLCGDLNVEVQGQDSLVTSESVLEHILNATTNKVSNLGLDPQHEFKHAADLSLPAHRAPRTAVHARGAGENCALRGGNEWSRARGRAAFATGGWVVQPYRLTSAADISVTECNLESASGCPRETVLARHGKTCLSR